LKPPFVLAISSFAVHGTASLKTFITILGEKVLPVPSLMLNGLTDMALVKKFDTPFKELLQSSLDLAVNRDLDLILYIGYLGKAEQADIILEMIGQYRSCIKTIITDPVCGDHGRTYVPDEVIEKWPSIVSQSDIVFPNQTEIKILTGNKPDATQETNYYIAQFNQRFPNTKLVVTSIKTGEDTIGIHLAGDNRYMYTHQVLPKNFGGSGDAFLSLFILNHFYKGLSFNDALKLAADQTYRIIKSSIEKGSDDLLLEIH
jgi:pyridoxal/pyridoxine/pyridoxamine kinase